MKDLPIPTASELKRLFAEHGVRPSRRRGQNFLVHEGLMRRIVAEAALDRRDVVLEAGAGTGGLTALLAESAGAVVAVEVDRKLHQLASERLRALPNVRLIHGNVIGPDAALAPEVRAAVESAMNRLATEGSETKEESEREKEDSSVLQARKTLSNEERFINRQYSICNLQSAICNLHSAAAEGCARSSVRSVAMRSVAAVGAAPGARFKVVANLPYCVSTAFISALLLDGPLPSDMVVTVQREVADRICAAPGEDAYGFLSVIVQAVARPKVLRNVSPAAFWPQPEVESSVLRVRPDAELRRAAGDLSKLRRTAAGLFTHRRKQLARGLVAAGLAQDRESAARLLAAAGLDERDRCERLSVAQFVRLADIAL